MSEHIQEDTNRLEETRRELDRLAKLRRDVASGLLEVSQAAKRDAERLLSSVDTTASVEEAPGLTEPEQRPVWSSPLLYGAFAVGLLCGFLLAVLLRTPQALPADEVAVVDPSLLETPPVADQPESTAPRSTDAEEVSPAQTAEPAAASTDVDAATEDLVLTLKTHRDCWLSIRVDGGETVERLLSADETVVLQVEEEATLRIGDAAALLLLINDQPTRSLGADGQVVVLRITPSNYQTFLSRP